MREKGLVPVVDTATRQVYDKPCQVYWLTANPSVLGTGGTLILYNGFSTRDPKVFEMVTGYDRFNSFSPPIACTRGLYVTISGIASYTIGFESEKSAKTME